MRTGLVWLGDERVGTLTELPDGGTRFSYEPEWLARRDALPVSLTLPLSPDPRDSRSLHPFFENLLPEGWLLELSTAKLKVSKDDSFGLLLALCRDCIGAVAVTPADD
jgi:serine/threonine-protein kinase HipA